MDKTFVVSIKSKQAKNLSRIPYVCGNTDYGVAFDFDEDWDQYPIKTARFVAADGTPYEETVIDNQCKFPQIMDTFRVDLGVYAGDLVTTTPAVVECLRSIRSGTGDTPEVPESDRYDAMMEAINADALRAEEAAQTAEVSATEAKEAADKAKGLGTFVVKLTKPEGKLVSSHNYDEITQAVEAGKAVVLVDQYGYVYTYSYHGKSKNNNKYWAHKFVRQEITNNTSTTMKGIWEWWHEIASDGHVGGWVATPAKTPNPYKLKLTGAVEAEYDGSEAVTVEIPEGGVDEEQLDQAVQEALQEAKDSGLFDGKDGYTPVKGKDYFDGKDGDDGISPTVSVSKTGKTTTISITDKNGTKTATINDGEDGKDAEGGEGGGGLPEGGEPNQMLVTDAEGNTTWEDRTHYAEVELGVVFAETTPVLMYEGQFAIVEAIVNQPTAGNVYAVLVGNEAVLEDEAFEIDFSGIPMVGIGNPGFMGGEDNGLPLFMGFIPEHMSASLGGITAVIVTSPEAPELPALSVNGKIEKIKKIDAKYLPVVGETYLLNGSALGSVRSVAAYPEDDEYKMGQGAFALGGFARGDFSFAVGQEADAEGNGSFALGGNAVGDSSFAANSSSAGGLGAFAANSAYANGIDSAAFGQGKANGRMSFAEGYSTIAVPEAQHAQGRYNVADISGKYAHIVGNGVAENARSNAHTIDWNGNAWFAGAVKVGGTGQDDVAAKELATKEYVENYIEQTILGGAW